jgi:AcrR family transcriptional regulator
VATKRAGADGSNNGDTHTAKFEARRNEIIDIAAALFAKNSYAGTGVSEISEAAKVRKGGLYYYIGSKELLLVEIHERVMQPLLEVTEHIASLDAHPLVRLRLLSESLLQAITERHDHVRVFLHEHRALQGELLEQFRSRRRAYEDLVTGMFAAGVEQGLFEIEDLRLTTLAFLGMHNSSYQWIKVGGRLDSLTISARYCTIFFDGITSGGPSVKDVEEAVARLRPSVLG